MQRMNLVVILVFWAFCAWLLAGRRVVTAFVAAIVTVPFGSLSVMPAALTGGLTILPSAMLSMIGIGLFVISRPGWTFLMTTAFLPGRLGLVTALMLTAALSAVFYPRIFAGMVDVVPLRGEVTAVAGGWTALGPSTQNISQLAYFLISSMLIFCFAFLMRYRRYQQVLLQALFASSVVAVITGALDYASQFANLSFLLDPFRNATYKLLAEEDLLNTKRVVGLMPEASAYGPMCVSRAVLLLFWKDAFESARLRRYTLVAVVPLLLLFAVLSTSSAAYLAIVALVAAFGLRSALQSLRRHAGANTGPFLWTLIGLGVMTALVMAYALDPTPFATAEAMVDRMIFGKATSDSFDQRMTWNLVSLQALAGTYGVGVGIGGTRTSSWPVAVATNLGIPGATILGALILLAVLSRKSFDRPTDRVLCHGATWALLPLISASALTSTTPNIGTSMALVLGALAAAGIARAAPAARPTPEPTPRGEPLGRTAGGDSLA